MLFNKIWYIFLYICDCVLTEVDVAQAEGVCQSLRAAQSGQQVAGEEEGRPASAEPAREEGSNKLNTSHKELEGRSNLLLNVDVQGSIIKCQIKI